MNHLSSRVISLVLAVIFLFSAAGISFATLFRGTTVYAEEGDTAGTTTQVESQAPKEEPDAVLSSSRAGSRMLAAANEPKTGEGTDTGDKNDEQDSSPNEYSIQGVEFWLGGERKQEVSSGQTVDRMVITIVDTRFSYKDYKDLSGGEGDSDEVRNKNFFASLNSENFKSNSEPSFVFKEGKNDSVYYTVTYTSVRYTGESKTLRLSVSYPPEWGIGMTDFSKELNELKVKSPSSEREHNKNDDDDDDSSARISRRPLRR